MKQAHPPSSNMRRLGRSREYDQNNMPKRLNQWHAPRANRWENLHLTQGTLTIEWLDSNEIRQETLPTGTNYWIGPGMRWRVSDINTETRFYLDIYANKAVKPSAPQKIRSEWLDQISELEFISRPALLDFLLGLAAGEHWIIYTRFDPSQWVHQAMQRSQGCLSWHPLAGKTQTYATLVVKTATAINLQDYLARDHAIIEAALAGTLAGHSKHKGWLHSTLARHLYIEEELIFPAYLAAGGKQGWVNGLMKEHDHLRYHLPRLASDANSQRKFLLLLDGHDEKEEQTVYPDVVKHLAANTPELTQRVIYTGLEGYNS